MAEYKLDCTFNKVAFLMDKVPYTRNNYLHLLITYWQVFDGIDIPDEVIAEIVHKATQPETITRNRRKVMEQAKLKQFLELQRMAEELKAEVEAPDK